MSNQVIYRLTLTVARDPYWNGRLSSWTLVLYKQSLPLVQLLLHCGMARSFVVVCDIQSTTTLNMKTARELYCVHCWMDLKAMNWRSKIHDQKRDQVGVWWGGCRMLCWKSVFRLYYKHYWLLLSMQISCQLCIFFIYFSSGRAFAYFRLLTCAPCFKSGGYIVLFFRSSLSWRRIYIGIVSPFWKFFVWTIHKYLLLFLMIVALLASFAAQLPLHQLFFIALHTNVNSSLCSGLQMLLLTVLCPYFAKCPS